jgi:hypothetical protein
MRQGGYFMKFSENDKSLPILNSVPEAARKMGNVSPHSIRAWLRDGRLERTKVGDRTMVSDTAIRRFIQESNRKER